MKTIKDNINNQIIIKNSKFITELIKINNINDIDEILLEIKNKYKDANHYCYAYIINGIKRFSDDGEPGGTAGVPILNVLEKNELNYILAVVIRYFGGIKLGAGGLVRAYSKSVSEAILKSTLQNLTNGYKITIEFDYDSIKEIDYILKEAMIINKIFDNKVNYQFKISIDNFDLIENLLLKYDIINKQDIIF